MGIFLTIALVFAHSLYQLFFDFSQVKTQVVSVNNQPITRRPASITQETSTPPETTREPTATDFVNLEIPCAIKGSQKTNANQVRLGGPICSEGAALDPRKLIKTEIVNQANKSSATVYTDISAGKFLTNYIPLNTGENPILIQFIYSGGKTVTNKLVVVKDASAP
jgi:hypothetical protein